MNALERFIDPISGFSSKPAPFVVEIFAWYLHEIKLKDRFQTSDIGPCFDEVHMSRPANVSLVLTRLCEKNPPRLIKDSKGYRLHQNARKELALRLPQRATSTATTALLNDLTSKVRNPTHKVFLNEALLCFRHHAYRAAIVMVWNLAYSHILGRIFDAHLQDFEQQRAKVYPKLPTVTKLTDFEDYGERQVIEICRGARIFSATICKILTERLNRRNSAAHPSSATFTAVQAEDMITDLVNNVLLVTGPLPQGTNSHGSS
ncbi:hypothetical protein SAMN04487926_11631 [Paraburkholderia steynii]|uniref:DUF4145 domain-containing protein n=1 Tax=Paraburkholderia steynii TaxID=1245441 RepID=A0A7Z7BAK7_9BURK|nr:hypothetical protein [Paraburkholderia steynii]SDI38909.1 hypothetical protein SAMN04487926_11631 [Paraburkholderia steynii]